jgi:hypothetical protein
MACQPKPWRRLVEAAGVEYAGAILLTVKKTNKYK